MDEFAAASPVVIDPGKVLAALSQLKDPRKKRGVRHRFAHLLVIMICSVVAGAASLVEMAKWAADTARDQLAALGIGAGRLQSRLSGSEADDFECAVRVVAGASGGFGNVGFAFETQDYDGDVLQGCHDPRCVSSSDSGFVLPPG